MQRVEADGQLRSDADDDKKHVALAQGKIEKPESKEAAARILSAATGAPTASPTAGTAAEAAAVAAGKVVGGGWDTLVTKVEALDGSMDGGNKLSSINADLFCLNPPPLAGECSVLKKNAVYACTHLEGCVTMSCAKDTAGRDVCHPRDSSATKRENNACADCQILTFKQVTVQKAAVPEMERRIGIHLQLLDDIKVGDYALNYEPGKAWFDGALEAPKFEAVQFQSDFDHVKIAGHNMIFLRDYIA
jgi:hypothetical protein